MYALQGGNEIPSGSDLNNYKSPGNYFITSNTVAESILNMPINRACTLKVEYGNGSGYPRQTCIVYNGLRWYVRVFESHVWSEWRTVFSV